MISPYAKGFPWVSIAFFKPWDTNNQKMKWDLWRTQGVRRYWTSKTAEILKKSLFRGSKKGPLIGNMDFFSFLSYLTPKYPIWVKKSMGWVLGLQKIHFELSFFLRFFISGSNLQNFKSPLLGNRLTYGQKILLGFFWGKYQQNISVWEKFEVVTSQLLRYCLILRKSVS